LATVKGVDAMFWNPAGMANSNRSEAMFSVMKWIGDVDVMYGAFSTNIEDVGSFGLQLNHSILEILKKRLICNPKEQGKCFLPNSLLWA
jgi:hypothetical protein